MRCPYCSHDDDHVVDSRTAEGGAAVRRRRQCGACGERFSTYERVEQQALSVRKRSGVVEPFDRGKVLSGILRATKNLEIGGEDARTAAGKVERRLQGRGLREVGSDQVGTEVLEALRELDQVAFLRFASVYKNFTSPEDFRRELRELEGLDKSAAPKRPR